MKKLIKVSMDVRVEELNLLLSGMCKMTLTPYTKKVLKKALFMITGEVGPEGATVGKKGQVIQSLILQADENCTLDVYAGKLNKTTSEEVIDRLAGRISNKLLLNKLHISNGESINLHWQSLLPVTIIPTGKVKYVMEVVGI